MVGVEMEGDSLVVGIPIATNVPVNQTSPSGTIPQQKDPYAQRYTGI